MEVLWLWTQGGYGVTDDEFILFQGFPAGGTCRQMILESALLEIPRAMQSSTAAAERIHTLRQVDGPCEPGIPGGCH